MSLKMNYLTVKDLLQQCIKLHSNMYLTTVNSIALDCFPEMIKLIIGVFLPLLHFVLYVILKYLMTYNSLLDVNLEFIAVKLITNLESFSFTFDKFENVFT